MKKRNCMIFQIGLLAWFFLAMTGIYFGNKCLVSRSYTEDGIFFVIYLLAVALFAFKEKIGKWVLAVWLSMWLVTQFLSHEWYTIFGRGFMGTAESKIKYFAETIHLIERKGRYIPDAYHIILHILIVSALTAVIIYIITAKKKQENYPD